MKKNLILLALAFACANLFSQTEHLIAKAKTPLSLVDRVILPVQDNEALLEAELRRRGPGIAPRFAVNIETDISPATHGTWEILPSGTALWRLRIVSKGAKSLNFGFEKYAMPEGGLLLLYSPSRDRVMGPFSPADNEEHEQFWTPVIEGDEIVIEVQVPASQKQALQLALKYVNHDFLGFAEMASGSCNLDVICGAADGWAIVDAYRDIIQSVAIISTGGATFCTGFLVNNARQDCTPYFMTAFHCPLSQGNAPSLVAYWNYINSTCRQPDTPQSGAPGNGTLSDFNSGSVWRAGWQNSDFTLVELDDPVSSSANAFFAGWSAEDLAPSDTVIAIHHPSTDEKRISFEFDPTFVSTYNGSTPQPGADHITVPDWEIGTTEGGSSGSPLFNRQKRVVGQLHGGFAACGNNSLDSYGRFFSSWEGGGTPTTRLKNWLDPDNTGLIVMDGRYALQCDFFVSAAPAIIEICAPDDALFDVSVSANFTAPVQLFVVGLPAGLTADFGTNPLAPGGTTQLLIGNTGALPMGSYNFSISGTDGNESNFTNIVLNIIAGVPAMPVLSTPANLETDISIYPFFTWQEIPGATYTIEIATSPDFLNPVIQTSFFSENNYQTTQALLPQQTYFWRVRGNNLCGTGDWSPAFTFKTGAFACLSAPSLDVPKNISNSGTPIVTSTLDVQTMGLVNDVNIQNMIIVHTWVSDLRMELTSPSGTTIELMNNVGGGDCEEDDLILGFDDQSLNPYSMLDMMCSDVPPALEGVFQPSQSLSAFNGEEAQGTWTLTVFDDANLDGGTLINWDLEICTLIPPDLSVVLSTAELENCLTGTGTLTVTLGNGFESANGVSLSANGLPAGATAIFSPNPAPPGSQVEVTLVSPTSSGVFPIEIVATDGAANSTAQVLWTVSDVASVPAPLFPQQGAEGVPLSTTITWTTAGANSYSFVLATDPGLSEVIASGTSPASSFAVSGLTYCTDYYWQVTASNACGTGDASPVFLFTTEDDLSFEALQTSFSVCNVGMVSFPVSAGACFEADGLVLSAQGLPQGAAISFSNNPVLPNGSSTVEIALVLAPPGTYNVSINGTDGLNAVSETIALVITGPPALPNLSQPANGATTVAINPTLVWQAVVGATSYRIELATDGNFTNVIFESVQAGTSFTPPNALLHLTTYYWRVTSINECGGSTTAPFSFTTEPPNAVVELNGLTLEIRPNPTAGLLEVVSSSPVSMAVEMKVFAVNGALLLEKIMASGTDRITLDLSGNPSGVYLLHMTAGTETGTERIVLK